MSQSPDPILHLDKPWMRHRVQIVEILLGSGFPPRLTDTLANFIGVLTGTSQWLLQYSLRETYRTVEHIEHDWKTKNAILWRATLITQKEHLFTDTRFIFYNLSLYQKEVLHKKLLTIVEQDITSFAVVPKKKDKK